ncbi:MAG TPA: Imm32 family immunity protein [Pyrinomonadaceae bacterium]|nr:Imm32 family immunity protein [Pyrinomonadaceae bacterium]HMP65839.1 Imm32 family immunity protein [Pyrinomonadaceae bacterium]
MSDEIHLLAFVVSEENDQIFLHLDKDGIEILMRSLERRKKHLEKDELEHEHLFSEEWGGWELTVSDQADKGKGRPIHHVKIYGRTDEWADKNGFDRTLR